jgi:hypothetical protein
MLEFQKYYIRHEGRVVAACVTFEAYQAVLRLFTA